MEEMKKIEDLAGHAKDYFQLRIREVQLLLAERTARVVSQLIADAAVILIFLVSLVFAGVAASYVLGRAFGNMALGFLLVAGFFLLLGILLRLFRQRLIRIPVMDTVVCQLFQNDQNDQNDEED